MLSLRPHSFRVLPLLIASFSIATSASAFELFLPPGATLEQVSNNSLGNDRLIGYPQLSGDGKVLYYVGNTSTFRPGGYDLVRWQQGVSPTVVMTLETQQFTSSVSRPTTSFDGSSLAFRSRTAPDGTNLSDAHLYLYEHGTGIRELFGDSRDSIDQPMITPDGSTIYFSSEINFGNTNPRHEMAGFKYDVASGQVTQVIQFPAVSQGSYPNSVSWYGVANGGRSLIRTNGNFDGTNPQNRVAWRILDGAENSELERLLGPFNVDLLRPEVNPISMMTVDGRYMLYTDASNKIWRYDAATEELLGFPFETNQLFWAMSGNGRYMYYAHRQDPATLHRLEIETGHTELLLIQSPELVEWQLATDYSGNRVAFRARENLTGMNPTNADQVFLLTLVPEPSGWQLLMVVGVCGVVICWWTRSSANRYRVGSFR